MNSEPTRIFAFFPRFGKPSRADARAGARGGFRVFAKKRENTGDHSHAVSKRPKRESVRTQRASGLLRGGRQEPAVDQGPQRVAE